MESKERNYNKDIKGFDHNRLNKKLYTTHVKEMGLGIPEGYFDKSKNEILAKVLGDEEKKKVIPLYRKKMFWFAAATIALFVALTVFKTDTLQQIEELPNFVVDTLEQIDPGLVENDDNLLENDVLISSLFIEDTEIDEFVEAYMMGDLGVQETNYN